MRKITLIQIILFTFIFSFIMLLTVISVKLTLSKLTFFGDFRGIILTFTGLIIFYCFSFAAFRIFLTLRPLLPGDIPKNSSQEFTYHIYLLFFLIIFYPIMRSGAMPVSLMRLVYLALGAKLGENTYSSGIILDPPFIEIGSNSIVGQFALLVPHSIENDRLAHYPIKIGNNVTIGAHSVVLAGSIIENDALVATGAIVPKGTHIRAGEVWGGVPAKRLKAAENND